MIRFACPGCGAAYKVEDAKGGKAGKCRKCQIPFVVPLPPAAPPPEPPPPQAVLQVMDAIPVTPPTGLEAPPLPPPPPTPAGVEIAPCPGCQARLTVDPANLGDNVECPFCKTVFAAIKPGAVLPQAPPRVIEAEMVRPGWPAREGSWQPRSGRDESAGEPAGGKLKKVVRTVGGTRTITRIGILSAAKMSAAMSFVISLIVALIYGAFLLFVFLLGASLTGDPSGILGLGIYAICALVIMPFLYALAGFIGGAIWALIYNLLAQLIGGIEVDLE